MASKVLALYRRLQEKPGGKWLFTRMVCAKAPYFGSIAPRIEWLEPGLCVGRIQHRRRVTNHIGTVHAIALCNLAELVMGIMVDASTPAGMRWIPKGMQVAYLKKAQGTITATARLTAPLQESTEGYEVEVPVELHDEAQQLVCSIAITCWISPSPVRG